MTTGVAMTTEQQPAAAETVFGDRLPLAERLVQHLVTSGVDRGLLGPREVGRVWTRHVLNCAVLTEVLPGTGRVVDVGSGAGLPGLVVALARPDLEVILVEPLERRVTWVREVAQDLGVEVTVHRARAEELAGQVSGQVVTARAVASLDRLLEWCLPLIEPGGQVLAIKGRGARDELSAAASVLDRWGLTGADVVQCGAEVLDVPTTVVRVPVGTHVQAPPGAAPRRRNPRSGADTPGSTGRGVLRMRQNRRR
jgi:16S rRNA (guanine527-N7)-methyltransferase